MVYTQKDVHALEAECIDLAGRLMSARAVPSFDGSVTRDDLGTLYVNLLALKRRAAELADHLERVHDFAPGKRV